MEREALHIIRTLQDAGFQAVYAGGYVRDSIIGVPSHDIDIATDATPDQVEELFDRTIPVGKSFGVVRVLIEETEFEVATFRKDGKYSDGRRPDSVEFASMEEDVLRRDFTINGLLYAPLTGQVLDFVGGQKDLKAGLVRFIGDPHDRIEEDKLRMLRGVRFAARFGKIEEHTLKAIQDHAHEIHTVSAERIQQELVKMIEVGKPRKIMDLLFETGLIHEILPEVELLKTTPQDPKWHPEGAVLEHTIRVMEHLVGESVQLQIAGMFHDIGKPDTTIIEEDGRIRTPEHAKAGAHIAREILKRLKFKNDDIELIGELVYDHMKIISVPEMRKATQKRFFAEPHFEMLMKLHAADRQAGVNRMDTYETVRALVEKYASEPVMPKPFVDGKDLIEMGMKPGKDIGAVKHEVYDLQLEGKFEDRDQALQYASDLVKDRS